MKQYLELLPARAKSLLFAVVISTFVCITLELMCFVAWRFWFSDVVKGNIAMLSGRGVEVSARPNTFWHHELNPNHGTLEGIVNSKGTKGQDFDLPKPAGELRIVCLGDSTVEGIYLAPEATFPYLLERILNDSGSFQSYRTVRVINAGIRSHNSAFNVAYLAFRLIHYQPDIIVIKSSYNDYLPYSIPGMRFDYTHAFPKPFVLATPHAGYWRVAQHSHLLRVIGFAMFQEDVILPSEDYHGHITSEQLKRMDFAANADKFYLYAENIRSMIALARARNIKVFVLDLPTSPDPKHYVLFGEGFQRLIRRLEVELERVTREENVPYVVTAPLEKTDFWDHAHNTPAGNLKIAVKLSEAIRNQPRADGAGRR